jgi:hypothetical protein
VSTRMLVKALGPLVVLGFAMMWTVQAKAQSLDPANDRLCAPLSTCGGTSSGSIIVTGTSVPALAFGNTGANETGTAWLVVLVPSSTDEHLSFSVTTANGTNSAIDTGLFTSGDLIGSGAFLPFGANNNVGPKGGFSPLSSASALSGAGTPTAFNVYVVSLGTYSSAANEPLGITINALSFPAGTVFWGFLTNDSGVATDSVPYSEAVVDSGPGGVTPEPGTLGLVGSGLLLLGITLRRHLGGG